MFARPDVSHASENLTCWYLLQGNQGRPESLPLIYIYGDHGPPTIYRCHQEWFDHVKVDLCSGIMVLYLLSYLIAMVHASSKYMLECPRCRSAGHW